MTGRRHARGRSASGRSLLAGLTGITLATLTLLPTGCAGDASRGEERPAQAASSLQGGEGEKGAPTADYYVSAGGSDDASGATPAHAWRTVERVNEADLRPGQTVRFRGGDEFGGGPLTPTASGRPGAPVRFTSYGSRRARLPGGVYLQSVAFVELDRLSIAGSGQGIASGASGAGARDITVSRSTITDTGIGINAANPADRRWRIAGNLIARTGDSGIIIEGAGFEVRGNTVRDTGRDGSIPYAKHGLYAKGPDTSVVDNRFLSFETEGVSTRYRNAHIVGNTIRGGETGVGYYREDPRAGTTVICGNRMDRVEVGVYIDPAGLGGGDSERFRIFQNRIRATTGTAIDARERSSVERGADRGGSGTAVGPTRCA